MNLYCENKNKYRSHKIYAVLIEKLFIYLKNLMKMKIEKIKLLVRFVEASN